MGGDWNDGAAEDSWNASTKATVAGGDFDAPNGDIGATNGDSGASHGGDTQNDGDDFKCRR